MNKKTKHAPKDSWHIVTSQGNVILGVYGSAILSMAQEHARRIERDTGFPAFVQQVTGYKPFVGGSL